MCSPKATFQLASIDRDIKHVEALNKGWLTMLNPSKEQNKNGYTIQVPFPNDGNTSSLLSLSVPSLNHVFLHHTWLINV
jgi:hypothetical protein